MGGSSIFLSVGKPLCVHHVQLLSCTFVFVLVIISFFILQFCLSRLINPKNESYFFYLMIDN